MDHNKLSRRRSITVWAAAALGTMGMTASCSSKSSPKTCLSPAAVRRFEGDATLGVTNDQTTWRLGTIATTHFSGNTSKIIGVVIGFKNPNTTAAWTDSGPVPPADASADLLKIGPQDVEFSAQIEATDSKYCATKPDTDFSNPIPLQDAPPNVGHPTGWHVAAA